MHPPHAPRPPASEKGGSLLLVVHVLFPVACLYLGLRQGCGLLGHFSFFRPSYDVQLPSCSHAEFLYTGDFSELVALGVSEQGFPALAHSLRKCRSIFHQNGSKQIERWVLDRITTRWFSSNVRHHSVHQEKVNVNASLNL